MMEFNINFQDSKELSQVFSKEVIKNAHTLVNYDDYESYIADCIKHSCHVIDMKKALGKAKKVNDEYTFCLCCSDYMQPRELKRILPCGHEFHKKCIDQWFFKKYSSCCPCCLQNIN